MVTFDLRETLIPFSLLQIANVFRAMKPGEVMEVISGMTPVDAATLNDVLRILPITEYERIAEKEQIGDEPVTRLRLRKRKPKTTQAKKGELPCQRST